MRTYFFLLLISVVSSFILSRWLAGVAAERGWARRRSEAPEGEGVPRLGGVSVLVSVLLAIALLLLWDNQVVERMAAHTTRGIGLIVASLAVFLLGLYDDLAGARPWHKLAVQTAAAVGLFAAGFRVELITNPFTNTSAELGWLALPVTVLWLVAISNAFNLIDGLDGLAAGVGFFATLSLFLLAVLTANSFVAATSAALAGSLLGFLPHNFAPARIYLGDSGSLTIGLVLGALAVQSAQKGPVLITVAIPLMIFGLPLLDVGITTVRRFLAGHPLFHRDDEHLHHRLVKIGLGPRAAVLVLYGVAALFALASLLLLNYRGAVAPLIALLCGVMAWVMVRQMQYPEFAELDSHLRLALGTQRAVLRNHILLRRTATRLRMAASADEAWQLAGEIFAALGFQRALCRMENGSVDPHELRWGRENSPSPASEPCWSMTIPLLCDGQPVGTLELCRGLAPTPLLFRVSSLLEFLAESFAPQIITLLRAESVAQNTLLETAAESADPA